MGSQNFRDEVLLVHSSQPSTKSINMFVTFLNSDTDKKDA